MLSHALEYARRGFAVFPLRERGKEPAIPKQEGGRGCLDATRDERAIRAWWSTRPRANVGVATGGASGVIVVDVDAGKGGDETMRRLCAEHGRIPCTLRARTGAGWHLYLSAPSTPIACGVNALGRGVDIRGEGGYVVAPPSIHPSGASYRWIVPDLDVAPCPAWIVRLLGARREPKAPPLSSRAPVDVVARARAYLARLDPSIQGENGSGRAMWAAVAMVRGFNLDAQTALALMIQDFNPRCVPLWSRRELEHKIASAVVRFTRYSPGFLLNVPRRD